MNLPANIGMHLDPPVDTATVVHESAAAKATVAGPETNTELETLRKRLYKFDQAIKKLQLESALFTRLHPLWVRNFLCGAAC